MFEFTFNVITKTSYYRHIKRCGNNLEQARERIRKSLEKQGVEVLAVISSFEQLDKENM